MDDRAKLYSFIKEYSFVVKARDDAGEFREVR
jgi:hypothetical protein